MRQLIEQLQWLLIDLDEIWMPRRRKKIVLGRKPKKMKKRRLKTR